jgi:predicted nicotinamide N-methyase
VLDHPETVRGKRILDFASGSGLSAIAAAKAGARHVLATEIDTFAVAAIDLNAQVNDVEVTAELLDAVGTDQGWDTVIAGDICYEREMSARVFSWLRGLAGRGALVLIGDPGRNYLPSSHLVEIAVYDVATTRELEDREVRRTKVWHVMA